MLDANQTQRSLANLLRLACICAFLPMAACSYGGGSSSGGGGAAAAGAVVDEEPPQVQVARIVWSPARGPVAEYDIEVARNGGPFQLEQTLPTQIFEVEGEVGERFRLRVTAVDADGVRGPASDPSDEIIFTEDGPAVAQASTDQATPAASTASLPAPASSASTPAESPVSADANGGTGVRGDVNGDGAADLIWASRSSVMATRLDGDALATVVEGAAPEGWDVAGFGDFDGDGAVDLLWTAADGALAYSALDDASAGLVALGVLEADETIVAVGDFDGSGTSDLIVRAGDGSHAWWKSDPNEGLTLHGMEQPDASSELAGSGDFDGDGTDDLLWVAADGSLHADFLAAGEVDAILVVSNGGDTVLGAGDFTGDGVDDVLIRDASGALAVLAMGERTAPSIETGPIDAGTDWSVETVADFDGNGVADVLWVQGSSRVLRLDGDPVDLPIDAGSDWMLVPAGL